MSARSNAASGLLILLLGCSTRALEKTFVKMKYCKGDDGCSLHEAFHTMKVTSYTSATGIPPCRQKLLSVMTCAHWCQRNASCLGFNYLSGAGSCSFFRSYSYRIYPVKDCLFYEVPRPSDFPRDGRADINVAGKRKTCQSSAALVGSKVTGAWLLVGDKDEYPCARTSQSADGHNWWMIDLERPIKLGGIKIMTDVYDSLARLKNAIVYVTNTSWEAGNPRMDINSSLCCTINGDGLDPRRYYDYPCYQSILPGRYVVIQQGRVKASPGSTSYFSLCNFQAFPESRNPIRVDAVRLPWD